MEKITGLNDASISIIGVGQGGGNLAATMATTMGTLVNQLTIVNASDQDFKSVDLGENEANIIRLPGTKGGGTGKDMSIAKAMMEGAQRDDAGIREKLRNSVTRSTEIIIIVNSADGGFGPGATPVIASGFKVPIDHPLSFFGSEFAKQRPKNPLLINISEVCSLNTAKKEDLTNIVTYLKIVDNFNRNKIWSSFIVDNKTSVMTEGDKKDKYKEINSEVAELFKRYLTQFGEHKSGTADIKDRLKSLAYAGSHALSLPIIDDNGITLKSPFIMPKSTYVKCMAYELNHDTLSKYSKLIESKGSIEISDSITRGFHSTENLSSIVHHGGFLNLSKIIEPYETRLNEIRLVEEEAIKSDAKNGKGFKNIDELHENIAEQKQTNEFDGDIEGLF